MGYFASLMRESGLRSVRPATRARSYAIDVETPQPVEAVAAPAGEAPTVPDSLTPLVQSSIPRPVVQDAASPLQPRVPAPERPVGAQAPFVAPARQADFVPVDAIVDASAQPAFELSTLMENSSRLSRPPEPDRAVSVGPRAITFADVREWVAAGEASSVPESQSLSPVRNRAAQESADAPAFSMPQRKRGLGEPEGYTLEIGTLQVVIEEPRAAPMQVSMPEPVRPLAASVEPVPDCTWSHASRHYLR